MKQTSFLDSVPVQTHYAAPVPMARASDPDTSHEAAENFLPKMNEAQLLALLTAKRLCDQHGDCSALEVDENAENNPFRPDSLRKRVHELVASGDLEFSQERKCQITLQKVNTFKVTPQGVDRLTTEGKQLAREA